MSACFPTAVLGFSENVGMGEPSSLSTLLAAASDVSGTGDGSHFCKCRDKLGAKEQYHCGDIRPHHQSDDCAQGAVDEVVGSEVSYEPDKNVLRNLH